MRFRTRAFLLCFVPFAVILTLSFSMMRKLVQSTVREGLRERLRENHLAVARVRSKSRLQNSRFIRVVGENVADLPLILKVAPTPGRRSALRDSAVPRACSLRTNQLAPRGPGAGPGRS